MLDSVDVQRTVQPAIYVVFAVAGTIATAESGLALVRHVVGFFLGPVTGAANALWRSLDVNVYSVYFHNRWP